MPSALSGSSRELALEIVRCPVLQQCIAAGGEALPCHRVAAGSDGPHAVRWFPEPWVGHLTQAPLLFVSSNPGGGGPATTDPDELSVASPDDEILDWADGAFDPDQLPGIVQGMYQVDCHGNQGKPVRYWAWTRARAEEVLPQPVEPGVGYALTEVVHCGTPRQKGVKKALQTCISRYLERMLAASPAQVVVLVGSVAQSAFAEHLNLDVEDHLLGPVEVAGRERLLVSVRHPKSRGGVKSFQGQLTDAELAQVRGVLAPTS